MEIGEIVKGYKIINHIGQGGAGIVYDVQKGSAHYALKECAELDEESLKRFARELRIAKTLNSPNIVKVIDEDIQADSPYYIMEMCEESLKQAVDRGLDKEQKYSYILQACNGFAELHNNGIIHRDIKPGNILIANGEAKVSDFGLGKFENRDTTTITTDITSKGTPGFMAPEIANEGHFKDADVRSDIFSIGALLYYVFSDGMIPSPINSNSVPVEILPIIRKCMEAEPSKRYQKVEEIISSIHIIMTLEDNYLSMKSLIDAQKSMISSDFSKRAYALLMKSSDITDLVDNLRILTIARLYNIVYISPDYGDGISSLIKRVYTEDNGQSWLQYTDVDVIVFACEALIGYVNDVQTKQDLIEVSLFLSLDYNRWECMKKVVKMANGLNDDEILYMTLFLIEHKDKFNSIQEGIGQKFKSEIGRFL